MLISDVDYNVGECRQELIELGNPKSMGTTVGISCLPISQNEIL